jgi:hypothetical protein
MAEPSIPTISQVGALTKDVDPVPACSLVELLQDVPLHASRRISLNFRKTTAEPVIDFPLTIRVHCENEKCDGVRRHEKQNQIQDVIGKSTLYCIVDYLCKDCLTCQIIFAVRIAPRDEALSNPWTFTKVYQEPPFGSPIPKRLFHVIGKENREYFLQARRAIARGLGIGAYAYYRRIVENAKFDLVGSVLEIAQATNAAPEQIDQLKKAQSERQFSKAIEMLRDVAAIPAGLLIDGHNPLLLLHDLLSEGVHQFSDSECLERAQD